jgi:hypothetical protein
MAKKSRTQASASQKDKPDLFMVKDIIDYRRYGDAEEYLVWWDGFSKDQSTWETLENIKSVEDDGWEEALSDCKRKAILRGKRGLGKTKHISRPISDSEDSNFVRRPRNKVKNR